MSMRLILPLFCATGTPVKKKDAAKYVDPDELYVDFDELYCILQHSRRSRQNP